MSINSLEKLNYPPIESKSGYGLEAEFGSLVFVGCMYFIGNPYTYTWVDPKVMSL